MARIPEYLLFFTLSPLLALGACEKQSLVRIILSVLPDLEFCMDQIHLQRALNFSFILLSHQ